MPRAKNPREPELEKLGARIRQLRIKAGFESAAAFADTYGLGKSQYLRHEAGQDMQYMTILRLARLHKLSLKEFFTEDFQ